MIYFNQSNLFDARKDKSLDIKWGDFHLDFHSSNEVSEVHWKYNHATLFDGHDRLAKHFNKPCTYGVFTINAFECKVLIDQINIPASREQHAELKVAAAKLYPFMLATVLRGIADRCEVGADAFNSWVHEVQTNHYKSGMNAKAAEFRSVLQLDYCFDSDGLRVSKE